MTSGDRTAGAVLEREFDATARHYDRMVGLNPGYHDHLRAAADRLVAALPADRPVRLADLGCGSGASTAALVQALGLRSAEARVVGVDASDGMLDVARGKAWPAGVTFRHGRAEDVCDRAAQWQVPLPLDGLLACYLARNVAASDRDALLRAVHDVLAPGGQLVVQDYALVRGLRSRAIWTIVCWLVVIPLSVVVTRRSALYRYLWRSVLRFDDRDRFVRRLREAGFVDVGVDTAPGWQRGILHTFRARRPIEA